MNVNDYPTPETDALIAGMNDDFDKEFALLTAHACSLERRLRCCRKLIDTLARRLERSGSDIAASLCRQTLEETK